jgi:hypothetical protein
MKCPKCKKEIKKVNVISECWQKGEVNNKGKIVEFGEIEEILETIKIEHRDNNCLADITTLIDG